MPRAQDAQERRVRCTGRKLFHAFSTLPPSLAVVAAGAGCAGAAGEMYGSKIVPCIFDTSAVPGGRSRGRRTLTWK